MPWTLLDAGAVGELPLELYERDGEHMVRVDGQELMSSLCHASEEALADLAAQVVRSEAPRILLAGLGLGYTLGAFVRRFGGASIEVVEKSPDVLRWYRRHFRARALGAADDAAVRFREQDAVALLRGGEGGPWDLVVLDVDNGPEPVAGEGNRWLYGAEGLAAIRGRLRPGGALLLWSGFRSEWFEARARVAGFAVSEREVPLTRPEVKHHLYLCALPA